MKLSIPLKIEAGNHVFTSNPFGANPIGADGKSIYAQFGLKGHDGYDWSCPTGTPLHASCDGYIIEQVAKDTGYGLRICQRVNDNGKFYMLIYGHMQKLEFDEDMVYDWNTKRYPVKRGQVIGYTDNTGFSTGPHLHFGIKELNEQGQTLNQGNGYGGYFDPQPYFLPENVFMVNETRIVLGKDGKTVWKAIPIATDWENFKKQASVEGIEVPSPIPPSSSL